MLLLLLARHALLQCSLTCDPGGFSEVRDGRTRVLVARGERKQRKG
jgi:hypothetical protein